MVKSKQNRCDLCYNEIEPERLGFSYICRYCEREAVSSIIEIRRKLENVTTLVEKDNEYRRY